MPVRPGLTMSSIWRQSMAGSVGKPGGETTPQRSVRAALRRPIPAQHVDWQAMRAGYTRTAVTEIYNQFPRLPNPDITLYIFPHLSGGKGEQVPIPGYTTVFPLYVRPHYAQPGERPDGWGARP